MLGIDQLRGAVKAFGDVREDFLQRFNYSQLMTIWRAWKVAAREDSPDTWEERQVNRALTGIVPTWDDHGKPTYPPLDEAPRTRDAGVF